MKTDWKSEVATEMTSNYHASLGLLLAAMLSLACGRPSPKTATAETLGHVYADLECVATDGLNGSISMAGNTTLRVDANSRSGEYRATYELDSAGKIVRKSIEATLPVAPRSEIGLRRPFLKMARNYPDWVKPLPQWFSVMKLKKNHTLTVNLRDDTNARLTAIIDVDGNVLQIVPGK